MDHFITQVTRQLDDFHLVTMANMELPKENHFDVLVTSVQTTADITMKIVTKDEVHPVYLMNTVTVTVHP